MSNQAPVQSGIATKDGTPAAAPQEETEFCLPGLGGEPIPNEAPELPSNPLPREDQLDLTAERKPEQRQSPPLSPKPPVEIAEEDKEPHLTRLGGKAAPDGAKEAQPEPSPGIIQQNITADKGSPDEELPNTGPHHGKLLSTSSNSPAVGRHRPSADEAIGEPETQAKQSQRAYPQGGLVSNISAEKTPREPKPFFSSSPPLARSSNEITGHQGLNHESETQEEQDFTNCPQNDPKPAQADPILAHEDPDDTQEGPATALKAPDPKGEDLDSRGYPRQDSTVNGVGHPLAVDGLPADGISQGLSETTKEGQNCVASDHGWAKTTTAEVQENGPVAGLGNRQHQPDESPSNREIDLDAIAEAITSSSKDIGSHGLPKHSEERRESGQGSPHHSGRGQEGGKDSSQQLNGEQEAEYEEDSSPYQSSAGDSSDDSSNESSDDSDQNDEDYQMLDPAEAARRLMQDDGGSDDEGNKKSAANGHVRTANEVVDETIEIPSIEVSPEMRIEELGKIEGAVDNSVLIKGQTTGEYQVLDSGSLLCLEDRKVIGVVAEPLGRVEQPRYCVLFPSMQTLTDFGLTQGTTIFYVPTHSKFVFTKSLQVKGSDASNLHDEEVAADEAEFSDDEAEAEYKRQKKLEKLAKKGINIDQRNGDHKRARHGDRRGGHRPSVLSSTENTPATLNYEEDDEPYTRLTRPSNLHQISNPGTEFPQEVFDKSYPSPRGRRDRGFEGRGRGDRGRGDRGRRDRGRGRGSGHNKHPQRRQSFQSQPNDAQPDFSLPSPPNFPMPQTPRNEHTAGSPPLSAPPFFNQQRMLSQYSPQQPLAQMQSPSFPPAMAPSPTFNSGYPAPATPTFSGTYNLQQFSQNHQGQYGQTGTHGYQWQQPPQAHSAQNPAVPPAGGPMLPPGAFVNPTFFSQQPSQSSPGDQSDYNSNHRGW